MALSNYQLQDLIKRKKASSKKLLEIDRRYFAEGITKGNNLIDDYEKTYLKEDLLKKVKEMLLKSNAKLYETTQLSIKSFYLGLGYTLGKYLHLQEKEK